MGNSESHVDPQVELTAVEAGQCVNVCCANRIKHDMLEIGACWRVWSTHRRVNPEEVSIRMSPGTPVLLHLLCHCKGL